MAARILFHRHTPWQSEVRCSTNTFAQMFLDEGFNVAYMQGLVHAGNVLARRGQWQSWVRGPRRDRGGWIFTPFSAIPYAKRWPFDTPAMAHASYRYCMPSIEALLEAGGAGNPDIIWSANPGSIALAKMFPRARFIFQAVDYYPAFSGARIRTIERGDYLGADHVFVIGEALKRCIIAEHGVAPEKITVLGQGVFNDRFRGELPMPPELAALPRPVAIYVGLLAKADRELMRTAAAELRARDGSLVLIGPPASWVTELCATAHNVHALGVRMPEQVPAYLTHADLGLMLYDQGRKNVYKGQNPLKLYELAAAGLPILSTPHDEFAHLDPPVIVVRSAADVPEALATALSQRSHWRRRSLDFAAAHDWSVSFDRARTVVQRLLMQ